ncbi:ABC transporter permease [Candidatus Haliotispira prima]|uniref:ABC transporter permease n=1 Tax=Candidatus Haliotispira prima TaxID=3034016 RepID=A0ABY8MHX6_9SPIO|nr:ABC transporter permease [Candidatus Haliotispira prima]
MRLWPHLISAPKHFVMSFAKRFGSSAALLALLFPVWELAVRLWDIPKYILPGPLAIGTLLYQREVRELLWEHTQITLLETACGLLSALLLALLLCLLMERFAFLHRSIFPLLVLSQTLPVIVIAPMLMIVLGFGMVTKITVITLYCFFPIATTFSSGLRSLDPDYRTLLRSFGAGFWQIMAKVQFRHALPGLFAGLRVAATYSVSGAVLSEFFGSSKGLGIYMRSAFAGARTDLLFLISFIIVFSSICLVAIVGVAERLLCRHQLDLRR